MRNDTRLREILINYTYYFRELNMADPKGSKMSNSYSCCFLTDVVDKLFAVLQARKLYSFADVSEVKQA